MNATREQTQSIFDRYATELLSEGKTTLVDFPPLAAVIFSYDPFNKRHVDAKTFILVELKLLPAHLYMVDSRRHILIDLQELSKLPPFCWPDRLKDLAKDYGLVYKEYYKNG